MLRIKLLSAIRSEPGNRRILRDAAKLAARWQGAKFRLNKRQTNFLRKALLRAMEAGLSGVPPEAVTKAIDRAIGIHHASDASLTEQIERTLTT
ncbi:MAG: hypothetical protein HYX80_02450 [Chloroflexi bacterium]|nr:hypothetical protein [Chloroflexota bacterium]